ncbi:hypothetical protein HFE03_07640 [Paenibacillus sp. EKM102P]|uniref:hypothetical protein n=1 Tax=unclassified Paenibacillus TaxID=185978 RepID=UPI00142D3E1E|nr:MULTISPECIES: hypothetical protein [unclassified Paenibacillus]KAF6620515.1 hypothetical protein HFE00_05545 [Paenibacillus sp. EKM101P]KAF6623507.1 hypothetical protein HFE03_07640 [Paenibacillus sp. EKM102P]KAF6633929.1 hypothetical protein HFE01_06865 [Paenibacillus sp. EKM10P]KAF6649457.1 hypothetical protein HFE02_01830 [Paenibacillus sp. EKM11P]
MEEFIKFYDSIKKYHKSWTLEVYHSDVLDWCISVGYRIGHPWHGRTIIHVQSNDIELAFAKAQVELKEWLLEKDGGY